LSGQNSTIEQRQTIIYEWYRNELKKQVQPLIEKWQKQIGVTVDDWQIKQMKTKWGTCNIEKKRVLG
jgi:predicted metal-dependent hydrolase